jgi:hypothetical protein
MCYQLMMRSQPFLSLGGTNIFKRTICVAFFLLAAISCWAEQPCSGYFHVAFVNFSQGTIDAPVFDADGNRLEGPNYMAELYALYIGIAPTNLPPPLPEELLPAPPPQPFRTGAGAGYFNGQLCQTREIPGASPGGDAWVQVRAWDARLGSTYEQVVNRAIGGYGESNIIRITVGGQFQGGPPANLIGLQSFSLRPISGVAMRTVRNDKELLIEWFGSFKLYQLQQTEALGGAWENLGEPTTALSYTNAISANQRFFRVIGLP